jgi:chromate reductase, NAD(P)H dehydrogenase (quinone)
MPHSVAIVVGSLREDSFNRKIANTFIKVAPPTLKPEIVEIAELTFFNQDIEGNPPASWVAFKSKIKAADAVLFVTPEYNRSMPGVLKNAIDVASRPYGQSAWEGKPAGIISGSVGPAGGFGANHHLRQSLTFLNMPAMQQPEAYLGSLGDSVDAQGELIDKTRQFIVKFAEAFAVWVAQHAKT